LSPSFASARAPTSSPTRCRRRSSRPRSPASSCSRGPAPAALGSTPTPSGSAALWPRPASPSVQASIRVQRRGVC